MPPLSCDLALDLIEPMLDGEPMEAERRLDLERHLETCGTCAAQLELARRIRRGLDQLPLATCPDAVVSRVLEAASVATGTQSSRTRTSGQARPRWLAAAAALLVLGAASWIADRLWSDRRHSTETAATALSAQELERAEVEARLALAYFAEVSDRVTRIVRDDVLVERVAAAPARAFGSLRWPGETHPDRTEPGRGAGHGENLR